MRIGSDEIDLAQKDGNPPMTLAAGSAPGESGVSVTSVRFQGHMHVSATARQHFVWFMSRPLRIDCRIGGQTLRHDAPAGSLAICPACADWMAAAEESADALMASVDPGWLALAAAEESALDAQITERLSGYDGTLLELAGALVAESSDSYPNGPLFWNDVASSFLDSLIARHTRESKPRGALDKAVLDRLRDYVMEHLDESIEVASLADIAARSPFHFTRVFTRSVGLTPHRYVVHLRLNRAVELVREGRSS